MIAKLFDPLGLVNPVIIGLKILSQELCTLKLGWDDEIPKEQKVRFDRIVFDLRETGKISLPRCLYDKETGAINSCYLHGFADASKNAYCAMIYLVYETDKGIFSRLICAKTRVAPLKQLSIPRLELMSGRILSTLMDTVYKAPSSRLKLMDVDIGWIQKLLSTGSITKDSGGNSSSTVLMKSWRSQIKGSGPL